MLLASHVAGLHFVPAAAATRHAPAPSHCPSAPHEAGKLGSAAHASRGSVPARTGLQVPFWTPVKALAQALHPPPHVPLQQKPSTQLPLAQTRHPLARQSAPALASQARPCPFRDRQSPSAPQ
jgi:hypothetical protein